MRLELDLSYKLSGITIGMTLIIGKKVYTEAAMAPCIGMSLPSDVVHNF